MAKVVHVKKAQQRYKTVPVIDPATGLQKQTPVMKGDKQKTDKQGNPVFRKQTKDDKTQPLPPYNCGACSKPIEVGTPYKHVSLKSGPYGGTTLRRHEGCPNWKQSELTMSKMSGVYAAQEDFEDRIDDCNSVEDLEALRDDVAEQIKAVGEEYGESADNIEDGFGHETYVSTELREKQEALEGWGDDIESVSFDEVPDCETCDGRGHLAADSPGLDMESLTDEQKTLLDDTGEIDCEDCEQTGKAVEGSEQFDEWLDEQRESLRTVVDDCPI